MSNFAILDSSPGWETPKSNACELIRTAGGCDQNGRTKLSRNDANKMRKLFAAVLGIDDDDLVEKLSDYYLKNKQEKKKTSEMIPKIEEE